MNLLRLNQARRNVLYGVFRVAFYSTQVPLSRPPRDSLHRRILRAGDPAVAIGDVVQKWAGEGKLVNFVELKESLRVLRKFGRHKHALQLLDWMLEKKQGKLSNSDIAVRLDLIAKVHGLAEAEKYFQSIPEKSRDFRIYGSLLSCYGYLKSVQRAESTMENMRKLGYARVLSYNVLLRLYWHSEQYGKMDALMQEMKDKQMGWNSYTYNMRLNAYAQACDVEGMERFLSEMESNPALEMDWRSYVAVANGYLRTGLPEKALAIMKKAEALSSIKESKKTLEMLLTTYSRMGSKGEVHRLWDVYRKKGKFDNTTFLAMVSSLLRLDDLAAAEQIVEEWESGKYFYDIRIPGLLITAYCKKGLLEKAEAYLKRIIDIGKELDAIVWDAVASGYESKKEMEKAVEALKKAVSVSKPGWRPNKFTLASCLDYLKMTGEPEAAKELLLSLRERDSLPETVYNSLLDYVTGNKGASLMAINQLEDASLEFR